MTKLKFLVFVCAMAGVILPSAAHAVTTYTVSPTVIDVEAGSKERVDRAIELVNISSSPVELYPFVYDVTESGRQPFLDDAHTDLKISSAHWVLLSRSAILLQPGEKKSVSFSVEPNLRAVAGTYHADIVFAPGSTSDEAQSRINEAKSVMLTTIVRSSARERLEFRSYAPARGIFFVSPVTLNYTLANIGNQPVVPRGVIRIYNRQGAEVGEVELNSAGVELKPGEVKFFSADWVHPKGIFGRYRAYLRISYGSDDSGLLQDSVFFSVLPLAKVLIVFFLFASLTVAVVLYLHYRRQTKFQ